MLYVITSKKQHILGMQRKHLEDADVVKKITKNTSPQWKVLFTLLSKLSPTRNLLLAGQKNALVLTVEITEVNRPRQKMDLHA